MAQKRRVRLLVGLGIAAATPHLAAANPPLAGGLSDHESSIGRGVGGFDGVIAPPCAEVSGPAGIWPVKCELPVEETAGQQPAPTPTPPSPTPPNPAPPAPPEVPSGGVTPPVVTPPVVTPPVVTPPVTPPDSGTPAPQPPPATGEKPKPTFGYHAPGELLKQDSDKGRGRTKADRKVYLRNIIFPIKIPDDKFAYMNSQIWGYGGGGWGGKGAAGGSERDSRNYNPFNQYDNYCEVRSHNMPLCPGGAGHQGQDIRPPTPENSKWEAVAVTDGVITYRSDWSTLRMKGNDGTTYEYLHLNPNTFRVKVGDKVKQGDVLGKVSNYMSGPNQTTIHLHFNAKQLTKLPSGRTDNVFVPVYSSLVAALRKAKGLDPGIDNDGNLIAEYPYEVGVSEPPPPAPTPPAPPVEPTPPAPTPPTPPVEPTPPAPTPPAPPPVEPTPPAPTPPAPPVEPTPPAPTPPAPPPVEPTPPAPTPPAPPVEPTPPAPTPPAPPVEPTPPAPTPPPAPPVEPAKPQTYWGKAWDTLANWWNTPWW